MRGSSRLLSSQVARWDTPRQEAVAVHTLRHAYRIIAASEIMESRQALNGDSPKQAEEASFEGLQDESMTPGAGEQHHRGSKDADAASHQPGQTSSPQMPRSLLESVRAKQSMKVYKRGKAKPRAEHSRSKIARNKTETTNQSHHHDVNGVAPVAPMTTQFRGSTRHHLRVTIHEARKLIAKDKNGYSDPFVQVELEGQHTRTRVVPSSLNPRWEQVVHLMMPQILDRQCDKLKLTVLDYDGPLLQPKFLGRVEIPVADVWHAWKQGNGFSHKWHKLLGNRRTKQSDRGDLCLSLSFVDSHELSESTNQFLGTDKSESLEDADLNEWNLRVRVHHARAFDTSIQDIENFDTLREYCYSVTVRLGSLERKTSFSHGNLSVVQEGEEQTGMFLHVPWEETFDIPLEEATKTLKLDARINNQIMQLGNLIGLDGKFYDARKAMTNTDDVRFLISRVSKSQDLPPSNNQPPGSCHVNGVGQFPLSAVFAFSTDLEEDIQEAEANDAGSSDKTQQQQQQQQQQRVSGRASSPCVMPEELPDGSPGDNQSSKGRAFMPRWQSFVNKAGKAFEESVGGWAHPHHSPMRSAVSEDGSDSDTESSSSSDDGGGVVTGPVAQQAWIPIDGRNGAVAAELLVSLMFVKGGPSAKESGPQAGSQEGQQAKEDFDQWLNDLVEPAGGEHDEPMAAPPPLKDATFVDEELDIPLHKLFCMKVNEASEFNKIRRKEQEIRDLEMQDWQDVEGGVKVQNSSFVMKLPPNKIGPNEAYTEVETVVETLSKRGYVLRQAIKNPQVTFGDTFYTMVQTVAIPVSPTRTRLQVSFASEFVKSCIFKSTIQRASLTGAEKGCRKELEIIKRLISGEDEPGPGSQSSESSNEDGMGTKAGAHGADARDLFGPAWVVSVLVALLVAAMGVLAMLVWNTQRVIALQVESQAAQGRLMERMLDVLDHLSESRAD